MFRNSRVCPSTTFSDFVSFPTISEEFADNCIVCNAPSKTFNIPGLGCSVAIIPNPELRKKFKASTKGLVPWVNIMGWTGAEAAYRDGDEWLTQVLIYLENNRNFVKQFVESELPEITMGLPEGTYLSWLDCNELDIAEKPSDFFLKQAHVAVNDGSWFGKGGDNFVRLNFATSRTILTEALERMKTALAA